MSRSRVLILPLLLVVLPACDWFGGDDDDDPGDLTCTISPREVTAVSFEQITFSAECPQPLFWTSWVDDPSEGSDAGIPPNFAVTVTAPQLAGTYEVYVRAMAYDLRDTATITVTERRDDVANRARISAHWSGSANFTDTTVTAWPGREALVLDDAFGFPSSLTLDGTWSPGPPVDAFESALFVPSPDGDDVLVYTLPANDDPANTAIASSTRVWHADAEELGRWFSAAPGIGAAMRNASWRPDGSQVFLWDDEGWMLHEVDANWATLQASWDPYGWEVSTQGGGDVSGVTAVGTPTDVQWAPDGSDRVATFANGVDGADGLFQVWDTDTGGLLAEFCAGCPEEARGGLVFRWTPDDTFLLGDTFHLSEFDSTTGAWLRDVLTTIGSVTRVAFLEFDADGDVLFVGSLPSPDANVPLSVQALNWPSGDVIWSRQDGASGVTAMDVLPDGRLAVAGLWGERLKILDPATGEVDAEPDVLDEPIIATHYRPDGEWLVVMEGTVAGDGAPLGTGPGHIAGLHVLDADTGEVVLRRPDAAWGGWHGDELLILTPDPNQLWASREWFDPDTGAITATEELEWLPGAWFERHDPDAPTVSAGTLRDPTNGEWIETLTACPIEPPYHWLSEVRIYGGGAVCERGAVEPVFTAENVVDISRDLSRFVALDGTNVQVWTMDAWSVSAQVSTGRTVECAALDEDGSHVAVVLAADGAAHPSFRVYEVDTGAEVDRFQRPMGVDGCVSMDWRPGADEVAFGTPTDFVVVRVEID